LPHRHGFVKAIPCGVEVVRTALGSSSHRLGDLVLYIGTAHRHKNLETLIDSFEDLPELRLVLVGPGTEQFRGLRSNVDARGWVSIDELVSLLSTASVFVNPSLYEGSGLPAMEALASGVPAILSDIPAFREVAGHAAVYVADPRSSSEWARIIREVSSNSAQLNSLRVSGLDQIASYSWDVAARSFVNLIEQCRWEGTTK
jgi:glycosyltransferase involved in cell wall biosynthesis